MEKKRYKASCPICGRGLFSGSEDSELELYCPKCNSKLNVNFSINGVTVIVLYAARLTTGGTENAPKPI